jgi:hypothetical protein
MRERVPIATRDKPRPHWLWRAGETVAAGVLIVVF